MSNLLRVVGALMLLFGLYTAAHTNYLAGAIAVAVCVCCGYLAEYLNS